MTIASRQLRDEGDYEAVRQMLRCLYAVDGPPDYCTVGSLDWWRFTEDDSACIQQARIWLDETGAVVGFAWLSDGSRLDHFSHPNHHDLEPEMVRWAEEQIRASCEQSSMTAFAYESHGWRQEQLLRLGFERAEHSWRYWHRSLDNLPARQSIGDYVVRNLGGDEDVPERVAAHRDAFAPSRMTEAKHRAVMTSPTYRQDLDLVVEAPDGTFAAYCIVWLDVANGHGVFEPVGCRPAHQRRGLATSVMSEGMRRIRDLGARTASVASHPTEEAANRLYASAGFTSLDVCTDWVKQLA